MAGTIIDALVVTLGLDSSGFKKGKKEVGEGLVETRKGADQTAKDMEAAGKRAASFFGSIRTELLALVGVTLSAQGIKTFITSMTSDLMRLGIQSRALDISAKSLDGWERAAAAAGSSAEKITGNLQSFQNVLTQIRTGGGQDDPLFDALASFGAATGANFDYQNDNSETIMRKIAENWNKLNKDAQRRFGGMLGFDNPTQQALSDGSLIRDADHFAQISKATDGATKKALDFNRRLEEMKQNFSAATQVLYESLIPYIEKLIPLIEKIGIWISSHGPEISKFFTDSAAEVSKVVDAVGGWQNALTVLAAFVAGSWALRIISAVGRVGKAFGPLLIAMAAVSAWDKLGSADEEAKKSGMSTGEYLVKKMQDKQRENETSGTTIGDKILKWWHGISGTGGSDNVYTAYGTSAPRGIRNNNPGNLNYAGQAGATKEGGNNGRFAVFQTMQDGVAALHRQLKLYFNRGIDTIEEVVNKYAPASDNNNVESYIRQLVGATGKGANEQLSADDNDTIFKLIKGIINHENGKNADGSGYVADQDILSGIQVGATSTAMRQQAMQLQQVQGNKTDIHIGEVNMQTSASNTNALGADLQRNVQRNRLITPSMSGQGG
ncbi:hypothetical protein N5923_23285 [Erwiniaceae bacterium BAC15a-03b]|uniref:Uncharacterized protein n=1 Tax=Winslowiella arboricola TaxID=2978220 RepID=A0A9J6PV81_9GAMM|nr:hypothetical protein [Winslowiella arboricola]MCU5775127.1 hypothetical protein [Winslowiella arboricola]MCU5780419.1 hypothetical protein [Winslowiella arboricola]